MGNYAKKSLLHWSYGCCCCQELVTEGPRTLQNSKRTQHSQKHFVAVGHPSVYLLQSTSTLQIAVHQPPVVLSTSSLPHVLFPKEEFVLLHWWYWISYIFHTILDPLNLTQSSSRQSWRASLCSRKTKSCVQVVPMLLVHVAECQCYFPACHNSHQL